MERLKEVKYYPLPNASKSEVDSVCFICGEKLNDFGVCISCTTDLCTPLKIN